MRRTNLRDVVAEKLAIRILKGTYPEGQTLPPESALLAEFDISRTCLREALQVISSKGLISSRPKRGTLVRPSLDWNFLDADMLGWRQQVVARSPFLKELAEVRAIVEPEAAALAAKNATPAEIDAMRTAYSEMKEGKGIRTDAAIEADVRLHRLILSASGNALLSGLGACIEEALRASIAITSLPEHVSPMALAEHEAVVAAIAKHDVDAARTAMRRIIMTTEETLDRAKAM